MRICRSTSRASGLTCATSRRCRDCLRSRSTRTRPRSPRAPGTSSAASWRSPERKSGGKLPIIHGVWADGSLEAARIAREAQAGGASALLVFPPAPFTLGQSAEMALAHFKTIADATDLPMIVFQYPLATGPGLSGGDAGAAVRRSADHPRHQGLDATGSRSMRRRFARCRGASVRSTCCPPTAHGS